MVDFADSQWRSGNASEDDELEGQGLPLECCHPETQAAGPVKSIDYYPDGMVKRVEYTDCQECQIEVTFLVLDTDTDIG